MSPPVNVYLFILSSMSLVLLILMGSDKRRARLHLRRIPEARLFLFALLGGAIGGIAGMYAFRHKTQHWYFPVGFRLIAFIQLAALYCLL